MIKFKKILFLLTVVIISSGTLCIGEDEMSAKVNLVEKLGLVNITKIVIEKEPFAKKNSGRKFTIKRKSEIRKILTELAVLEKESICDCEPEYKIMFYKKDLFIEIGYQGYADHYYLRYKTDEKEEQAKPSKEFYDIINELITR